LDTGTVFTVRKKWTHTTKLTQVDTRWQNVSSPGRVKEKRSAHFYDLPSAHLQKLAIDL